jgi:hypothetical protein
MYILYKSSEYHFSGEKPSLDDTYDYFYADVSTPIDEIVSSSFNPSTNTLVINGTTYTTTQLDTNHLSLNTQEVSVTDDFVITSEKSDTLTITPVRNANLEPVNFSVSAGSNSFNINAKGYYQIVSQNKVSEILFLKVYMTSSPPATNYITSV